jgi:hypothetical protein
LESKMECRMLSLKRECRRRRGDLKLRTLLLLLGE